MRWYYLYVLLSMRDRKFYIGTSTRLKERIIEHQKGKNVSTAKRRPLTLVYFEGHRSKLDALRRERYFKTAKGKTTLRQITRKSIEAF